MAELGWLLYVVLAVLLYYFWTKVRGCSLDDLLERATREHHRVHDVLTKHPQAACGPSISAGCARRFETEHA